jgi:glycerol uptake facilitator protein
VFVLLFGAGDSGQPPLSVELGFCAGMGLLLVGLLVRFPEWSLGGPSDYAIHPARDLSPQLAHALLPSVGKGPSDWSYAWVPIVGPILGGVLGAWLHRSLWT